MAIDAISLRFADAATARAYPAPVGAAVNFTHLSDGSGWEASVPVGDVAAGAIIAPSLALLGTWPYQFRFELEDTQGRYPLPPVPSRAGEKPASTPGSAALGMLDCWHVEKPLQGAMLRCVVCVARQPQRYLLTVSVRARCLEELPPPPVRAHVTVAPPHLSQMLENPRIANRICSPVSLAMALSAAGTTVPLHELLPLCRDPATGMYGMWPLAIRAASRFGRLGAVELLSDWQPVCASLDAGVPVVASIRFGNGELDGSPQRASGGHLVVVHGIEHEQILVNDPAAPHRGAVARRYPLEQFAEAWFRHRGAAYILLP